MDEPLIGVFVVVLVPAGIWYPIFGMSHVDTISRAAVLMLALGVVAFVLREAWAKHWEYAKRFTASADPGRARPSSAS